MEWETSGCNLVTTDKHDGAVEGVVMPQCYPASSATEQQVEDSPWAYAAVACQWVSPMLMLLATAFAEGQCGEAANT